MDQKNQLVVATRGRCKLLTLDRPEGLNAISAKMLGALLQEVRAWNTADEGADLVLDSSSKRAFCAGADVRAARENVLAGRADLVVRYFSDEYEIQRMLHDSEKKSVALVEGLCMGAGMGLAVNSTYSLVSENSVFAMPETSIGFFPDAGATYFLNQLPPALALYLGLTGARLTGADMVNLGLASHLVEAREFDKAADSVRQHGHEALPKRQSVLPPLSIQEDLSLIEECFSADSMEEIRGRLTASGTEAASSILRELSYRSPHSLHITLGLFKLARGRTQRECLALELEAVREIVEHPDFAEGIRALLVDKDRKPVWA